jgi:hypothetical protein
MTISQVDRFFLKKIEYVNMTISQVDRFLKKNRICKYDNIAGR